MKINPDSITQLTAYLDADWRSGVERSKKTRPEMLLMSVSALGAAC